MAAAGVLALAGVAALLLASSDASRAREEAAALAMLHELRDMDARRDAEAQRMTSLSAIAPSAPDREPQIARILDELGQAGPRRALGAALEPIRAAMMEKQAAHEALRQAHGETLEAMEAATAALAHLVAEAPAARAREPQLAEAAAVLAAHAERIRAVSRTADIESPEAVERALEVPLATLAPIAGAADLRLAQAGERAEAAAREFLRARGREAQAWRRFASIDGGQRIEATAQALSRSIAEALEGLGHSRAYGVAGAAGLLIALGYLAWRLAAAGATLRAANQDLERRLAERTRALQRYRPAHRREARGRRHGP
jgi:Tfp pilus assembly protein PilV